MERLAEVVGRPLADPLPEGPLFVVRFLPDKLRLVGAIRRAPPLKVGLCSTAG